MTDDLVNILPLLAAVWCGIGLWALTLAYIFWDGRRRNVPDRRRAVWLLVGLIPFFGFIIYLVAGRGAARRQKRVTQVRQAIPAVDEGDEGTIPAAYWRPSAQEAARPGPLSGQTYALSAGEGPYAGRTFPVSAFPAQIGRSADCALRLEEDLAVSRRHAELYRDGGTLRLRDLDSTHGTYVNGRRIRDEELAIGDTIQTGNSVFIVEEGS